MLNCHIICTQRALLAGGIIAYPTESVYGLGCLAYNENAVSRLLMLKRRTPQKTGLIIVAASKKQLLPLIETAKIADLNQIWETWPGPVTWVFPANRKAPKWLRGKNNTLAVRVSAYPVVRRLCQQIGPLISTSANYSGAAPALNTQQVRNYFGNQLDFIYPAKFKLGSMPTEIRLASNGKIIRKANKA